MRPLAIDLFCGLGGWAEGLLAEGYDVIGFDIPQSRERDDRSDSVSAESPQCGDVSTVTPYQPYAVSAEQKMSEQTTRLARDKDPDETAGRKLYRDTAESLARAQVSLANRRVMTVQFRP